MSTLAAPKSKAQHPMGYSTNDTYTILSITEVSGSKTETDCAVAAEIDNSSGLRGLRQMLMCKVFQNFQSGFWGPAVDSLGSMASKFRGLFCTLQPGQHVANSLCDLRRFKHLPCLCRLCLSLQKGCASRVQTMLGGRHSRAPAAMCASCPHNTETASNRMCCPRPGHPVKLSDKPAEQTHLCLPRAAEVSVQALFGDAAPPVWQLECLFHCCLCRNQQLHSRQRQPPHSPCV